MPNDIPAVNSDATQRKASAESSASEAKPDARQTNTSVERLSHRLSRDLSLQERSDLLPVSTDISAPAARLTPFQPSNDFQSLSRKHVRNGSLTSAAIKEHIEYLLKGEGDMGAPDKKSLPADKLARLCSLAGEAEISDEELSRLVEHLGPVSLQTIKENSYRNTLLWTVARKANTSDETLNKIVENTSSDHVLRAIVERPNVSPDLLEKVRDLLEKVCAFSADSSLLEKVRDLLEKVRAFPADSSTPYPVADQRLKYEKLNQSEEAHP